MNDALTTVCRETLLQDIPCRDILLLVNGSFLCDGTCSDMPSRTLKRKLKTRLDCLFVRFKPIWERCSLQFFHVEDGCVFVELFSFFNCFKNKFIRFSAYIIFFFEQVNQCSHCRITERQLFVSGIQCRGDFPVLESGQCSDSFLFVIKNLQCSRLLNPHRRVSDSHSRLCVWECECCFSGL